MPTPKIVKTAHVTLLGLASIQVQILTSAVNGSQSTLCIHWPSTYI